MSRDGEGEMKIEWLNDSLTEAIVTRGFLRRRYAVVRDIGSGDWYQRWSFVPSGNAADRDLQWQLHEKRIEEQMRQREQTDWQPVEPLAVARTVRR